MLHNNIIPYNKVQRSLIAIGGTTTVRNRDMHNKFLLCYALIPNTKPIMLIILYLLAIYVLDFSQFLILY